MQRFEDILKEVTATTLPIAVLILVLNTVLVGATPLEFAMSIGCFVLVIIGFAIFLYGIDIGVIPMGKAIGLEMARRKSIILMVALVFIISLVVTIAEPDVTVFSSTVSEIFPNLDSKLLVMSIALGVGFMLILATLRLVLNIPLKYVIFLGYAVIIILGFMVPKSVLGIALDSGGVTTGPVTIPVLMAIGLGIGVAVSRSSSGMNSFGMIGLASIGPLITVMIFGCLSGMTDVTVITEYGEVEPVGIGGFISNLISSIADTLVSVLPLYAIFILLQKYYLHCTWRDLWIMSVGIVLTMAGMIMFLTGVYSAFMPLSKELGVFLVDNDAGLWILLFGMVAGFLVIVAEPAVKILGHQVESVSRGVITNKVITAVVGAGVSLLVGIGMFLMTEGLMSITYVLPLYAISMVMLFLMDEDLIGISYDAGGVATGPMSVAIIMSMYAAMAQRIGGQVASDNAFGVIALIALAPIMALSLLGVYIRIKKKKLDKRKV